MGGEQVNAKEKKDTKIELNAVDVSYQEKMGDGGNLEYSWTFLIKKIKDVQVMNKTASGN
uniref:Uncharacterized protein n=1 Tax=Magallana gigas TaxID=29159 RepID=K1Q617_MAGGI